MDMQHRSVAGFWCSCGEHIPLNTTSSLEETAEHVKARHPDELPAFSRMLELVADQKAKRSWNEALAIVRQEFPKSVMGSLKPRPKP